MTPPPSCPCARHLYRAPPVARARQSVEPRLAVGGHACHHAEHPSHSPMSPDSDSPLDEGSPASCHPRPPHDRPLRSRRVAVVRTRHAAPSRRRRGPSRSAGGIRSCLAPWLLSMPCAPQRRHAPLRSPHGDVVGRWHSTCKESLRSVAGLEARATLSSVVQRGQQDQQRAEACAGAAGVRRHTPGVSLLPTMAPQAGVDARPADKE